jgi:prevent-host-death family protein
MKAATAKQVGVRELKANLSAYLRQVKAGRDVVITERGRAVARLIPETETPVERLDRLVRAGVLWGSAARWDPGVPPGPGPSGGTVAALIGEGRD